MSATDDPREESGGATRVLVVDDEPRVRASLAAFLIGRGYEVHQAANGKEAIAALSEARVDVVVTDVNMPDMDGIELIVALRESDSGVRVIAMSGGGLFDRELLLDNAGALGADVTLEKPFDLEDLGEAVASQVRPRGC